MLKLDEVSKAAVTRAISRARSEKPKVHIVGEGIFNVASSADSDTFYNVIFHSEAVAECDCYAHKKGNTPKLCKHITATFPIYQKQLADKLAVELARLVADTDKLIASLVADGVIASLDTPLPSSDASDNLGMCSCCNRAPAEYKGMCDSCLDDEAAVIYG